MIDVKIEGASFQPSDQVVIEQNNLAEREFGTLTVYAERSERFETYDRVDITIGDTEYQYLVQGDQHVKFNPTLYEHQLTLFENIAKFDAFYPADRKFSRIPAQTIGDILNVYKRELKAFHGLEIDFDANASWTNALVPEKEFVGLNFSTIVADLFRKINAHPKVTRDGDKWVIFPRFFSERGNPIGNDIAESVISKMRNQDYATRLKSQLKNGVFAEYEEVWFPSKNGSVLPKSSTPQRIQSNLRYELDSPIVDILAAVVPNVTFTVQKINENDKAAESFVYGGFLTDDYSYDPDEQQEITEDVDVSELVVTREEYDTLPTLTDLSIGLTPQTNNTRNSVYYSIGSRYVENLFRSSTHNVLLFFEGNTSFLRNAIERALYKKYVQEGPWDVVVTNSYRNVEEIPMRFKYIRQRDVDIAHHRQYVGAMNDSTQIHSQRDSFVEVGRYLESMKNIVNQLGNETKDKTKTFTLDETPYKVTDYDNEGRVIVRTKYTYSHGALTCEYTLVKNNANLDAEASLRRQPSPFTITQKNVRTNVILNEYVEISETDKTDTSRMKQDAKQTIVNILRNNNVSSKPIKLALFQPRLGLAFSRSEETNGIVMPVFSGGGGNTMTFHTYFDNVYLAGNKFTDNFAEPIVYTYKATDDAGPTGSLLDYTLFFTEELEVEDDGTYPLNSDYRTFFEAALTDPDVIDPIDLDINASFAQTYNIHFVSDDERVIIGDAFAELNFLHRNEPTGETISFVRGTTPFTIYDKETRESDQPLTMTYNVSLANNSITFNAGQSANYWAIVLGNKILLAFNKTISTGQTKTYYFNFLEAVTRVLSNTLKSPLLVSGTSSPQSITRVLNNINNESVDFVATLTRRDQVFTQLFTNVSPLDSRTVLFAGLEYGVDYNLTVQSIALPGSSNVDSLEAVYTIRTPLINVLPPTVNISGRSENGATFEFDNPNNFDVQVLAKLNGEMLFSFPSGNEQVFGPLFLDALEQGKLFEIEPLDKDGYYELTFTSLSRSFPRVESIDTEPLVVPRSQPPLPIVSLIDDVDTTISQFKMQYTVPSTADANVEIYVSVNETAYEMIGVFAPGSSTTVVYDEQNLGIQLGGGNSIPVSVYFEYEGIGIQSLIQDRVTGKTRPVAPTFEVDDLTPYDATVRVINQNSTDNGFVVLTIPSLGITTNVPSGNFYELNFDTLVPNQTYAHDATFTYAGLAGATTTISFTTLDGPAAEPTLIRVDNDTTTTSIKIRFFNNDTRTVTMFGGLSGRQLESIASVSGGSSVDKTFAGLKPGSRYDFSGQARTGTQLGPVRDFTTYTRPSAPQAQLVGTDGNSATFRLFNGGNDYQVDVYTGSTKIGTVQSGDYLEYTRTGLAQGTTYTQTFFNRFEGLDSGTDSVTYTTVGTPSAPLVSISSSNTTSITPLIESTNDRTMTALATFTPPNYNEIGTVSANGSIVGYTFTDDQLEANRGVTYYAKLKDFVFGQYESVVTSTTLYTSPLKPTNIIVAQTVTGGPEYVNVQVDFFNPNDAFGPNLNATMIISQQSSGFQERFTITNITPNATNTIITGTIRGLEINDFTVTIILNNPTSNGSETIQYNV